jgi:sorting nexin-13
MNELIIYLLNNNNTSNEGGTTNVAHAGTVALAHDSSPCKSASQGFPMESRNSPVEPSGFVPVNNSGTRSLVACEGRKSEVSEDDRGSASQPRQPDWAVSLDAATKRRTEVLAPENLEKMWAIGRNYQKKMVKAEHSSRFKSSGGLDGSPNAVAAGKELSSNFNERITSVDDKYMVNLMPSTNRNAQSTFVTGSHPLALHNTNEVKSKEGSRVNFNSKEKPLETNNTTKAHLKRSSSTPDIEKKFFAKSNQTMATSESLNARKNTDAKSVSPVSHVEVALHVPKIRCRVILFPDTITTHGHQITGLY